MNRSVTLAATFAAILLAAPAVAQSSPAEVLFREARGLMEAKKYAEACPKLAESQRLEPAAGTALNLADCYEKNGQTASAWLMYKEAAKAAVGRNRPDWVQTATQRSAALEPKVSWWSISVDTTLAVAPSLHVERDGVLVPKEEWANAIPVDPGAHVIVASARGRRAFTARVEVGAAKKIVTAIPMLEADGAELVEKPEPPPPKPAEDASPLRTVGWIVGGAGIVAVAVGGITGLRALSLRSDANGLCGDYPNKCRPDASSPNDDALTMATVSTVSLVAGVVLIAAGAVLVLTSKSPDKAATARASTILGASF